MSKNAVISGAGSGVGQAVAVHLVQAGWQVALIGRREEALKATAQMTGAKGCLICPGDIGREEEVRRIAQDILAQWTRVDALVNAAGTNVPQRSLAVLSPADYHAMMDTNLNGAYYLSQAFLPPMRAARSGTIVHIVSEAGKWASPKAGPAYVMSKFGQTGLVHAINAEERANGIRACAIFPGDIDTPLLEKRPNPPSAEARTRMLTGEDVALCVGLCLSLPARAVIEELLLRPA
jgi:NADP-dependent 3-hydroxy acid dehydrogenase YdfG